MRSFKEKRHTTSSV